MMNLFHPATETYLGVPGYVFAWVILIAASALFSHLIYQRYLLLSSGQPDPRFSSIGKRLFDVLVYGFIQKRQPRYLWTGVLHLMIFWGFVVLGLRSIDLVTQGLNLPVLRPLMAGGFGTFYTILKDIFELVVLVACIGAMLKRATESGGRYEGSHRFEAYLVLCLISFLMLTDMFYEGSALLLFDSEGRGLTASRLAALLLPGDSPRLLKFTYLLTYWLHLLTFFFFLNLLPLSKHFHIITALPNIFFRKLSKGSVKPARWGIEQIEELESSGTAKFEDLTWKHILDFFSCTECGRCSDNCPANAVGRPLSPKMLTIKLRDYGYRRRPIWKSTLWKSKGPGTEANRETSIAGGLLAEDEIWSCTTCGACEEECPVCIEYIDKVIDFRRHLIETSRNPKTFNQILMYVEKTGNPFGKPAAKRAEWLKGLQGLPVKVVREGDEVDVLYFVDGYGSYDPRIQEVSSAIVKGLNLAGIDFGILGPREKDSGHQVRRMGEEGLFQLLVEENMETLNGIRFKKIVTTDPHAFNTLKKDYPASFEVYHYLQFFLSLIENGRLKPVHALNRELERKDVYTYHDPCYLGRHNEIYDEPRRLLKLLPGMNLVEMERSKDRSFCCGGGDISLWHEIEREETRMSEKRIQMALEAGANILVTACPFCLLHFEDAIKTGGLENRMKVVDLMQLLMSTL